MVFEVKNGIWKIVFVTIVACRQIQLDSAHAQGGFVELQYRHLAVSRRCEGVPASSLNLLGRPKLKHQAVGKEITFR